MESVYSIDKLLARFSTEKLLVIPRISDHPNGILHAAVWSSEPMRRMIVLELTRGEMVLATKYQTITVNDETWVSPCFVHTEKSFDLRCAFQFPVWKEAELSLFLGLNPIAHTLQLWVHYGGQIYRPPLGNIFDGSCQICLGHNEKVYNKIFHTPRQPENVSLNHALGLLNDSMWNGDTFNAGRDLPVLNKLIRFDSSKQDLPMLPVLQPELISKCAVAANRDLAQITNLILKNV